MEPVVIYLPMFASPVTNVLMLTIAGIALVRGVAVMVKKIPFF